MLKSLSKSLQIPISKFPRITPSNLLVLLSGFSLSFCLYVYQAYAIPAGNSDSGHGFLFRVLMFGLLTSLNFGLNEWLYQRFFKEKLSISLWRILELILGATLTFLLYNIFWEWTNLSVGGYAKMLFEYTGILIFPIFIVFFYEKYIYEPTQSTSEYMPQLLFKSSNGKHVLSIEKSNFLFVKSEDNYVRIAFLRNGIIKYDLIRSTLNNIENSLNDPKIKRCHRSYIVNTANIEALQQKNRKVYLQLKAVDISIPVSAKYAPFFSG